MNLNNINRIHFIGIGGIGMSALARLFLHEGKTVSGSDAHQTDLTKKLSEEGIEVSYDQSANNIQSKGSDPLLGLVVYTEAMAEDNPELVAARAEGIKTVNYFEALGMVANEYYLIAVAGTHGKSTTTSMLTDVLEEAGLDPSAIIGSLRSKTGSNYRAGKSKYMIVEACEYRRDFMHLRPDVLVITNVELEHVDYYKDLADVQSAFRELAEFVPEDGAVVCDTSDLALQPIVTGLSCQLIDYRQFVNPFLKLRLPGVHNRLNAAAATGVADFLKIDQEVVDSALKNYAGIWRRFEYKGDVNNAPVYDDYSHHPTEVKAAIAGARELYPEKKITVVFQSHTYSRTRELFSDFVSALSKADRVIMLPIYPARQEDTTGVSAEDLVKSL